MRDIKYAQDKVKEFNAKYPVGTEVIYLSVKTDFEGFRTKTRTEATVSLSGAPVVWLDGKGSCVSIEHLTIVS